MKNNSSIYSECNLDDWIRDELYPVVYEKADLVLTNHVLKRYFNCWRKDPAYSLIFKSYMNSNLIIRNRSTGYIIESDNKIMSFVDYIMNENKVDVLTAIKSLAELVSIELPKRYNFNAQAFQEYNEKCILIEECNKYYCNCLEIEQSEEVEDVRLYLSSKGYSKEEIKEMELGFFISKENLFNYLEQKGYEKSKLEKLIGFITPSVGKRVKRGFNITIPYRSVDSIKGFIFRAIPSYLNHNGVNTEVYFGEEYYYSNILNKPFGFFSISGSKLGKDLIVLEDELDVLYATVKEVGSIVSIGKSVLYPEQVNDAIRRGIKNITFCLSNYYKTGTEADLKLKSCVELMLKQGIKRIYIGVLIDKVVDNSKNEEQKKKKREIYGLTDCIEYAKPFYEYWLEVTLTSYISHQGDSGNFLTKRNEDRFLDDLMSIAAMIPDAIEVERFKKLIVSLDVIQQLGISEKSISLAIDKIIYLKHN